MSESILKLQHPDEAEAVFYESFARCDLEVMQALWAQENVICIHPGSGVIKGYEAVMRSWTHIFAGAQPPRIDFDVIKRESHDDIAIHLVVETLSFEAEAAVVVLATNVYKRVSAGWRMIEHHASVVQSSRDGQSLQ